MSVTRSATTAEEETATGTSIFSFRKYDLASSPRRPGLTVMLRPDRKMAALTLVSILMLSNLR